MQNIARNTQTICKPVLNIKNSDKSIFCIFCIYIHSPLCWWAGPGKASESLRTYGPMVINCCGPTGSPCAGPACVARGYALAGLPGRVCKYANPFSICRILTGLYSAYFEYIYTIHFADASAAQVKASESLRADVHKLLRAQSLHRPSLRGSRICRLACGTGQGFRVVTLHGRAAPLCAVWAYNSRLGVLHFYALFEGYKIPYDQTDRLTDRLGSEFGQTQTRPGCGPGSLGQTRKFARTSWPSAVKSCGPGGGGSSSGSQGQIIG